MPQFIVYSRRGCHLCEQLLEELEPLCRGRAELTVRDVDDRAEWVAAYGVRVPVLVADGEELCCYTLDRARVMRVLGLA